MADPEPPPGWFQVSYLYDASPEAVFAAWVDPDQVAVWWVPEGLEIPSESVVVEPRVGGRFELDMIEPGGTSHPLRSVFEELVEPELIVLRSEPIPGAGLTEPTLTRATFVPEGDGTRMTVTAGPYPDQMRGPAEAGWRALVQNLEKLLSG